MGYRQADQKQPIKKPDIEITRGDPEKGAWVHGKITDGSGYRFSAKLTPVPTRRGLDGGKIEKLALREENGYVAAFYDKRWLEKPNTWRDQQAVSKIQDVFHGRDKEFTPIVPKSNDKDKGRDR